MFNLAQKHNSTVCFVCVRQLQEDIGNVVHGRTEDINRLQQLWYSHQQEVWRLKVHSVICQLPFNVSCLPVLVNANVQ